MDVKLAQGNLVLVQTKDLFYAAGIGKLLNWWEGPFKVIKEAAPNAYLLQVAMLFMFYPIVNVDCLCPSSDVDCLCPSSECR